ncbi:hypothetical protein BH11MYX4_BH11MYX4_01450 [soil metagenome]
MYFQDKRESAQGMSIFATKVAIATPSDTGDCVVEIALAGPKPLPLRSAVQAVAFPFDVKGPLFLRTVSGDDDDDDDIVLPHGAYDVVARFLPKKASKDDVEAGLRAFQVHLDFHPRGTLTTPACLALEHGKPPKTVFAHR